MKKAIFIIFLVFAFNFSAPGNITIYSRQRHLIEYSRNYRRRDLDDDDIIRAKFIIIFRLEMLGAKIERIDRAVYFDNTGYFYP
jgi:hypothetical protein